MTGDVEPGKRSAKPVDRLGQSTGRVLQAVKECTPQRSEPAIFEGSDGAHHAWRQSALNGLFLETLVGRAIQLSKDGRGREPFSWDRHDGIERRRVVDWRNLFTAATADGRPPV
jgi:hypothetical protein